MVFTEPDSVWHLTPKDTARLPFGELFAANEDARFSFRLTSNLFDERYSVLNKGFIPSYSPVISNYTFSEERDGYSLKNVLGISLS